MSHDTGVFMSKNISPFMVAINQICDEKNLAREIVVSTVESALGAAYRREYGKPKQIIRVKLNEDDLGKSQIFQVFNVVNDEELTEEANEIKLSLAKKKNKKIKVGDEYIIKLPSKADFGRIAAQTAKQVIIQRLQEAERDVLYKEYKAKEKQLVNVSIQQVEGRDIIVNLGKINALMPTFEQIRGEKYYVGQRLKVYIIGVEESSREPKILVSRSRPEMIIKLFEMEVPEIQSGTVEIKGIAREAGSRTKLAVIAHQEGLDPVGSCVGQRGIRVQAVLAEIGEEKIDIVLWDKVETKYITNALSPAKIENIKINKKKKEARVSVIENQLSLAIGKNGQNVRLASKLTGYNIDIKKNEKHDDLEKKNGKSVEKKLKKIK